MQLIESSVSLFDDDYEMEIREQITKACATVLCSTFSPDGYLLCGTMDGRVLLWEMEKKSASENTPDRVFVAHKGPVYSLLFVSGNLVSGGDDGVALWNWAGLLRGQVEPVKRLTQGTDRAGRTPEVNGLTLIGEKLATASGDNNIYCWDLTTGTVATTLSGHKDAVYCVATIGANSLSSGSEDGIVNIWDVRTGNVEKSLEHCTGKVGTAEAPLGPPGKHTPYISCLAVDPTSEYLVCGGGARILSLWHLTADKVLSTMPTAGNPQTVLFYKQGLLSAGNDRFVYQWEREGKMVTRTKTNAPSVFTISQTTAAGETSWLASAGTGLIVDLLAEDIAPKSTLLCDW